MCSLLGREHHVGGGPILGSGANFGRWGPMGQFWALEPILEQILGGANFGLGGGQSRGAGSQFWASQFWALGANLGFGSQFLASEASFGL